MALLLGALSGCALAPSVDEELYGMQPADTGLAAPLDAASAPPASVEVDARGSAPEQNEAGYALVPPILQIGASQRATDAGAEAPELDAQPGDSGEAGPSPAGDSALETTGASDASRVADSAASAADAAAHPAAAGCQPISCPNRCALLNRCCNANDQCACQDPVTRLCTLSSL
jgi:hypothetical protein